MPKQDGEKEYSLKNIEVNLINAIQQAHQAEMGNIISFIALERLAYQVTENTQFRVEDNKVFIREHVLEPDTKAEEEVATS